ncbi:calcium-binding protein [[Roseibacterium] beibuensis]|uniref:calcium-binding protein n=1 Tax=[Roseibacterium] beibuensis TaxID=1193142 RepID=UPI00217D7AE9|nr:calcium-binding protein [Roseibacterium beibuensis]
MFAPLSALTLRSLALGAREQFSAPGGAPTLPPAPPTPDPTGAWQPGKYIVPQGDGPHVIAAGTELAFRNLDSFDRGDVQVGEGDLVNNGRIISVNGSQYGTMAVSTRGPVSDATASITNNGAIYAHATGPDGMSWGVYAHAFTTVVNTGLIQSVSDMSRGTGVTGSFSFQNTATGVLRVHSQAYALGLGGGLVDNAGLIEVIGGHTLYAGGGAFAVREPSSFNNSGTIRAESYSDFYISAGLIVDEILLEDYYNSGTIIAQYAYYDTTLRSTDTRSTTFHNSGSMIGDMVFGKDTNTLLNTGLVDGNVFFDDQWDLDHTWQDPNVYDGRGGTLTGGLFLGRGSATVWLGDGGEAVYTAGGKDTVHGGGGADLVDVVGGALTAEGGGGYDILSWYSSSVAMTIDAGAGTASGVGQTTSFSGFEAWIGSSLADSFRGSDADDYFAGEAGDDVATGGLGADRLDGGWGDDIVTGGGGADLLDGGFGADTAVFAGNRAQYQIVTANGVTTVTGPAGDGVDTLRNVERLQFSDQTLLVGVSGTDGADALHGTAATDYINGFDGDDLLSGGAGDDHIDGADGADTAVFSGPRSAYAVSTVDGVTTISGPDGTDTLASVERLRFSDLTLLTYGDGGQYFGGGSGGDTLVGTALGDEIEGLAGNDVLRGEAGNDLIRGGDGADLINAGSGRNTVFGDGGDDTFVFSTFNPYASGTPSTFEGGAGLDTYDVSGASAALIFATAASGQVFVQGDNTATGVERIISGSGADTFNFSQSLAAIEVFGGGGGDFISGGAGHDQLHGGAGADILWGGAGDHLYGDAGDDTIAIKPVGSSTAAVTISGGAGIDRLDLQGASLAFDLASGEGQVDGLAFTASGMERVVMYGVSAGQGTLSGGGGNDILSIGSTFSAVFEGHLDGRGGNDALEGTYWNDVLIGGSGDDVLNGVSGSDRLEGGDGVDTAVFFGGSGYYTVRHYVGYITVSDGANVSRLYGIERIRFDDRTYLTALGVTRTGTSAGDVLTGSILGDDMLGLDGNDILNGGAGDDILNGGLGNDQIDGGAGDDVLVVSGVAADYRLLTDGDNFILKGADGRDNLIGVERIHFSDGSVLELNRIYWTGSGATDGIIPQDLLSPGFGDGPQVLPGVSGPASEAKDGSGPQVLPDAREMRPYAGLEARITRDHDWMPAEAADDDAFVLPALPDDEPLVLPGLEAFKAGEEPLVLPGAGESTPLLQALEARLALAGDRMLTLGSDGRLIDEPAHRDIDWL